mgnify:CR=1
MSFAPIEKSAASELKEQLKAILQQSDQISVSHITYNRHHKQDIQDINTKITLLIIL